MLTFPPIVSSSSPPLPLRRRIKVRRAQLDLPTNRQLLQSAIKTVAPSSTLRVPSEGHMLRKGYAAAYKTVTKKETPPPQLPKLPRMPQVPGALEIVQRGARNRLPDSVAGHALLNMNERQLVEAAYRGITHKATL